MCNPPEPIFALPIFKESKKLFASAQCYNSDYGTYSEFIEKARSHYQDIYLPALIPIHTVDKVTVALRIFKLADESFININILVVVVYLLQFASY